MNRQILQRLTVGGVSRALSLCALFCGGCLSAAWQQGGTDAVGLSAVEPAAGWRSGLPPYRSAGQVAGSLASAGYDDEGIQAITNSGWRIGALFLTGDRLEDMEERLNLSDPVLSAWGYQFQFQRGRAGSTVGLVDVIPLLMGLDESLPIPAVNVLVGLRYKSFEFGLGPHFSPRAALEPYWSSDDEVHVDGLGLVAAVGYWYRGSGGVNLSVDFSFMLAGDLEAFGVTFGWNFAN